VASEKAACEWQAKVLGKCTIRVPPHNVNVSTLHHLMLTGRRYAGPEHKAIEDLFFFLGTRVGVR